MGKLFIVGGMGAIINCAFSSAFSLELLFRDLLVEPIAAVRTLLPAALGFLFGTLVVLVWNFLRAMVIRFLLDYNGWFLSKHRPINKLWYLLMVILLGKKNMGSFKYQNYLPSYPVPPLGRTCKRYLASVRPLLTDEEYANTEKAVALFESKEGRKLQFYLKLRALFTRNWLCQWWLEYIYLRQRSSIAFNSNYFGISIKDVPTPHMLDRAAMCSFLSIEFYRLLIRGKLENMKQGVVPFCMDGGKYLGNTTRIPGKELDRLVRACPDGVHHVVVARNGRFYKVQVISKDGVRLAPPTLLKKQLQKVMDMAGDEQDTTGYAALTGLDRPSWAAIREQMEKDPLNKETLNVIDSAITIIALDDSTPADNSELANCTFEGNMYNRWFDKSVTLIFNERGQYGCNVEHSPLDATVCAQSNEYVLSEEVYDEEGHIPEMFHKSWEFPVDDPVELQWNTEGMESDLERAKENLKTMSDDSDLVVFSTKYGKRVPKKCRLSPDGWIQMSLQLAYYRLHGALVQTYESATTRMYYKGRTETIRPVSVHSKAFVQSIDDTSVPRETVKQHLREAIKYQETYKFEAMRGLGIDRHLFGLYIIAKWLKLDPLPKMFQDKAFNLAFQLSTSQTPVHITDRWELERCSQIGGFGTVCEDGYGLAYIVTGEDKVNFSVHSKRSCSTTSSAKMVDAINAALEDMKKLYE